MHLVNLIITFKKLFTCCPVIDLNIKTGTVGHNNKIIISNGKFCLGKNDKVNALEPTAMKSHKVLEKTAVTYKDSNVVEQTAATHKDSNVVEQRSIITHKEEKIVLVLSFTGIFTIPVSMNN